ncbi:hypothetical protein NC652_018223 [Populus alba x Populus x berolinensis]|nr:hypothetical protein NC652_018223 [Populus alba x Populus x berolinensis]
MRSPRRFSKEGALSSLQNLRLSGNNLSGEIPASFKRSTSLRNLWLNNQNGGGLSGTLDVVTTMDSVNVLWLHGNQFTQDLNLNGNKLVGFVPDSLAKMPLEHLDLNNNQLMGPVPNFKATEVSYASNAFCQSTPGVPCAPEVMALLSVQSKPLSWIRKVQVLHPANPSSPTKGTGSSPGDSSEPVKPKRSTLVAIIAPVASVAVVALLAIPLSIYCYKKRKDTFQAPSSLVIHPRDPSDSDNTVKIVVANNTNGSASTITGSGSASRNSSGVGESHLLTGLMALDEDRPEESQYLAAWFWRIKSDKAET